MLFSNVFDRELPLKVLKVYVFLRFLGFSYNTITLFLKVFIFLQLFSVNRIQVFDFLIFLHFFPFCQVID